MGGIPNFSDEGVIQKFEAELEPEMESSRIRDFQAEREAKLIEIAKLKKNLNL